MTGLQTATDIVALVYMGVMLLLVLVLLITGLVIKRKIARTQANIQAKLDLARHIPYVGRWLFTSSRGK